MNTEMEGWTEGRAEGRREGRRGGNTIGGPLRLCFESVCTDFKIETYSTAQHACMHAGRKEQGREAGIKVDR